MSQKRWYYSVIPAVVSATVLIPLYLGMGWMNYSLSNKLKGVGEHLSNVERTIYETDFYRIEEKMNRNSAITESPEFKRNTELMSEAGALIERLTAIRHDMEKNLQGIEEACQEIEEDPK